MNLIRDKWIPIRRKSGKMEQISPSQICERDIVSLAAPRPDFNGALIQFLIGLLQTTCAPENPQAWRRWLREPPSSEMLQSAFEPVAHAFELDGVGARFFQDFTLEKEVMKLEPKKQNERKNTIYELLIDEPTGKTLSDNTDHFTKGGSTNHICLPCGAMALMTLQMNAPSGGSGHRTSLRGGGPMTTLVLSDTFWETCWFNILEKSIFLSLYGNQDKESDSDRFPWFAKTRTSEGGKVTTPEDTHPDQVFWSMPRRIRLIFSNSGNGNTCHLCGTISKRGVSTYLNKNQGVNYKGSWRHPLTPYFIAEDGSPSSMKLRPGGISYRHWLGLVQSSPGHNGKRQPAKVLEEYLKRKGMRDLRLWTFGYDMDNKKARCWYDSTMPLLLIGDEFLEEYNYQITSMIQAAEWMSGALILSFLHACYFQPSVTKNNQIVWKAPKSLKKFSKANEENIESATIREGKSIFEMMRSRFWQETEADFFHFVHRLRNAITENENVLSILEAWHRCLTKETEVIFDELSQTGSFEAADPKRIALAWGDLKKNIRGKKVRTILGLPAQPVAKNKGLLIR